MEVLKHDTKVSNPTLQAEGFAMSLMHQARECRCNSEIKNQVSKFKAIVG
jgi:hypothetical protein